MRYIYLILIFILIFSTNVFSQVDLSLDVTPNFSNDTFYISKNISKTIPLKLTSDYSSKFNNYYRAEYQLTNYSNNSQLILSLSKNEEKFISNVTSRLSLNIRSLDFSNDTVIVRVKVSIFDVYYNLVDQEYLFLRLVSNNSEYEFSNAPKMRVPEYKGYSLSRDKMFILNRYDSDLITIKNHVDQIYYGLDCSVDKAGLFLDLRYKGDNLYTLEVSISDFNISKEIFNIDCFSYYKENIYDLKTINVNYLDQNIYSQEIIEEEVIEKSRLKIFFENLFERLF